MRLLFVHRFRKFFSHSEIRRILWWISISIFLTVSPSVACRSHRFRIDLRARGIFGQPGGNYFQRAICRTVRPYPCLNSRSLTSLSVDLQARLLGASGAQCGGKGATQGRVATAHRSSCTGRWIHVYVCICMRVQHVHARECKQPECLSTRRNRKLLGEHASSAALRAPSGATAQEIRVKPLRDGGGSEREG